MKAVILAGGLGSRLGKKSTIKPKPMHEIGGNPILWHIMKIYEAHGVTDFIICAGYLGHLIQEFAQTLKTTEPSWTVICVDTGVETLPAGRIKRIEPYLAGEKEFFLTYGDAVSDVDISETLRTHQSHGKLATLTVVKPEPRFGTVTLAEDGSGSVLAFKEKDKDDQPWINGGFFVLSHRVLEMIPGDATPLEDLLSPLAERGELISYQHPKFWKCMDYSRELKDLNKLWESGHVPWILNWKRKVLLVPERAAREEETHPPEPALARRYSMPFSTALTVSAVSAASAAPTEPTAKTPDHA